MKLNIAIITHGRFHIFDLARELIGLGHNVTLFTNYPCFAIKRFGIQADHCRTFFLHLLMVKMLQMLHINLIFEKFIHWSFGFWAAKAVSFYQPKKKWDVIMSMSGVALEAFENFSNTDTICVLCRGSTHISDQYNILYKLKEQTGCYIELPSKWMILREIKEYKVANVVHIPSRFALAGFVREKFDEKKCGVINFGVDVSSFNISEIKKNERYDRIKKSPKIRVLNTGNFSMQKGALDYKALVEILPDDQFEIRHVGAISNDAVSVFSEVKNKICFFGKVSQFDLNEHYLWADIFIILSIQDGFSVVVTQAMAMGLPVIATTNVGSSDLITDKYNGYIVPICDHVCVNSILIGLYTDRNKFLNIAENSFNGLKIRTWKDVAVDTVTDLRMRMDTND